MANNPRTNAPWAVGDRIYRKEEIGKPGQIYEHEGQIHFEICCDKESLQRLIGRAPDWVHPLSPQAPTQEQFDFLVLRLAVEQVWFFNQFQFKLQIGMRQSQTS